MKARRDESGSAPQTRVSAPPLSVRPVTETRKLAHMGRTPWSQPRVLGGVRQWGGPWSRPGRRLDAPVGPSAATRGSSSIAGAGPGGPARTRASAYRYSAGIRHCAIVVICQSSSLPGLSLRFRPPRGAVGMWKSRGFFARFPRGGGKSGKAAFAFPFFPRARHFRCPPASVIFVLVPGSSRSFD